MNLDDSEQLRGSFRSLHREENRVADLLLSHERTPFFSGLNRKHTRSVYAHAYEVVTISPKRSGTERNYGLKYGMELV